ncbi:unnamed protein product, partial [Vitis vinifera]
MRTWATILNTLSRSEVSAQLRNRMLWRADCEIVELVGNRSKDSGIGTFSSCEVFNCSKTEENVKVTFVYELHSFERLNDLTGQRGCVILLFGYFSNLLDFEECPAASTTTNSIENKEALETSTIVSQFSDLVQA